MSTWALVVSCEHASRRVPTEYAHLFASRVARSALETHEGYDIGALGVARELARSFGVDLHEGRVTRLLVDLNRSSHHPRVLSRFATGLDADARRDVLDRHHTPHRARVEADAAAHIALGRSVLHVGVHSFTPRLAGHLRTADVGLLYDPRRPSERRLCSRWQEALQLNDRALRVRRNYPYRGTADGLTTHLRRALGSKYMGIELELNQAALTGNAARRREVVATVCSSLRAIVATHMNSR